MLTLPITGYTEQEALQLLYDGLVVRQEWVLTQIERIKGQLSGTPAPRSANLSEIAPTTPKSPEKGGKKRHLSPEARQSIANAQKKRWRKHKRTQNAIAAAKVAKRAAKVKPRAKKPPKPAPAAAAVPIEAESVA